jgi:hypothetical protein
LNDLYWLSERYFYKPDDFFDIQHITINAMNSTAAITNATIIHVMYDSWELKHLRCIYYTNIDLMRQSHQYTFHYKRYIWIYKRYSPLAFPLNTACILIFYNRILVTSLVWNDVNDLYSALIFLAGGLLDSNYLYKYTQKIYTRVISRLALYKYTKKNRDCFY